MNSGCSSDRDADELLSSTKTYDGNSAALVHTVIVPTLDTPIPRGKNVIWCSSFQIAWNELKDNIIKEPVQIIGAQEVADRLNLAKQSRSDVPGESCYAASGFVKDGILAKIQKDMVDRFPSVPEPQFDDVNLMDIIAYAYLQANVKFKNPFFENRKEFTFTDSKGNKTAVVSFGIRPQDFGTWRKLREQVEVLFTQHDPGTYKLQGFALDLCKYTKPTQIALARIEPSETLAQTLANLEKKIATSPTEKHIHEFGANDVLLVPNMFWRVTHHFHELEGKSLGNGGYEGYYIKKAMQMVEFRLDRSGAELKSEAKLHVASGPSHFMFDRPFLIYMKKRGAEHPFFVMWVDNAELLSSPEGN
ncbi:MAG: hypothetical protein ACYTEL_18490 [Planctomycetota bacterium]|jgi:hypothetical protein